MSYLNSVFSASNQVHAAEDQGPTSGGGLSQNGKFSYGYASSPGKRSSMEDFYETRIDGVHGEIVGLFGVFDGHGGVRAAEYVKQNLFSNLINHPKFITDTKSAIAETYTQTDSEFLKSEHTQNRDAGSTASTAILVGNRLLVANVGDSRAVICRGGNAFAVSRDHKPDQSDERQRIEDAGGFVMWAGTWRVGGVLAVSRAFGDRLLKQYVVADPEIQEEEVDSSLEFLILASDGLWDVVTNDEAVAMIKPIEDSEEAAKRLLQEASQRGSADNITCVVVRFLANQGGSSRSNPTNQGVSSQNYKANNEGSIPSSLSNKGGPSQSNLTPEDSSHKTNQSSSSRSKQANLGGTSLTNPEDSSPNQRGYSRNNPVHLTDQMGSSHSNPTNPKGSSNINQSKPEGSLHNHPTDQKVLRDNLVNLTNQMGSSHGNKASDGGSSSSNQTKPEGSLHTQSGPRGNLVNLSNQMGSSQGNKASDGGSSHNNQAKQWDSSHNNQTDREVSSRRIETNEGASNLH